MGSKLWVRRQAGSRTRVWLLGLASLHALLLVVLVLKVCGSSPVIRGLQQPGVARARRDTGLVATALVLGAGEDNSENCTPRAVNNFPENFFSLELTEDGAVVLHILIAFYLFAALAIICDDYFVPSLERICKDLQLKEDVAGATFMAAGSSAPELCTSIVGLFIARSDVGVGTIVGSAVFNILFIIGICGLFAGMVVQLTWYPLVRDTLFYLASVVALVLCIQDSQIHWYEALIMLLMYCVYIVIMYFNSGLERYFLALWARLWSADDDVEARQPLLKSHDKTGSQPLVQSDRPDNASVRDDVNDTPNKVDSDVSIKSDKVSDDHVSSEQRQLPSREVGTQEEETSLIESVKTSSTGQDSSNGSDEPSVWEIPEPFLVRVLWVAMVPMKGLLYLTVPDCRQERMRRLYPLTFVMSVVWIAASSYVLVWMITIAGDALQVPDTVMGLTLLAAGTSLPDCLASLFVARDGFGDMAVSNSIGSNVFDILICLGLPWLIETAAVNSGDHVTINSSGLLYSSLTLLATVIFLLVAISINKWRLTPALGLLFLAVYALVMTLSSLFELNVFADLNPPSCPR